MTVTANVRRAQLAPYSVGLSFEAISVNSEFPQKSRILKNKGILGIGKISGIQGILGIGKKLKNPRNRQNLRILGIGKISGIGQNLRFFEDRFWTVSGAVSGPFLDRFWSSFWTVSGAVSGPFLDRFWSSFWTVSGPFLEHF